MQHHHIAAQMLLTGRTEAGQSALSIYNDHEASAHLLAIKSLPYVSS